MALFVWVVTWNGMPHSLVAVVLYCTLCVLHIVLCIVYDIIVWEYKTPYGSVTSRVSLRIRVSNVPLDFRYSLALVYAIGGLLVEVVMYMYAYNITLQYVQHSILLESCQKVQMTWNTVTLQWIVTAISSGIVWFGCTILLRGTTSAVCNNS